MKKLSHFLKTTEGKFLTFIAAFVALSFAYYFYAVNSSDGVGNKEIVVTEQDHIRGAITGKVTLVEFGDFQCPACAAYEPIVRQVTEANADTLKVVFKHYPLVQIHANALLSAKASEAAALQGKFWEMHDMLYDKQGEWSSNLNARSIFSGYADALGLDRAQFEADLEKVEVQDKILAEYKEGAALGVQGTPTFFLNGKMIQNPGSVEEFNKMVREAAQ